MSDPTTEAGRALLRTISEYDDFFGSILDIEAQARREAYAKVRAAVNEHADIRLPDGRLAIAREVAVLLIDTLMGDDDGR